MTCLLKPVFLLIERCASIRTYSTVAPLSVHYCKFSTIISIINKGKKRKKNKGDRLESARTIKHLQTTHEEMGNYKQQSLNLPKFHLSDFLKKIPFILKERENGVGGAVGSRGKGRESQADSMLSMKPHRILNLLTRRS